VSADSSSVGGRAEVWFVKKVGVSAALFRPSPDEGNDIDYLNLDVKWRLLSPTENNFLAVGAGWQKIDISGDEDVDSSGVRLVAEGRVGLVGIVYAYGRVAYLPSLDDIDAGGTPLTDGSGTEYEAGVQLKPMPFVQFFLGYRSHEDSWTLGEDGPDVDIKTDGFVLGAGVNF
jgi:hypothetical protein